MAESLALVPVFTGTLNAQSVQLCDARTLHTFMGVLRDFSNWIKGRIRKFKFVEGVDYLITKTGEEVVAKTGENLVGGVFPKSGGNLGGRPATEYHLTLDMAKELAMVENNDKGREARRYFIACEKQTLAQPLSNTEQLPSPYITPAQAQHLRELVQIIVESGKQGHGETWNRLHRKMKVNSYLNLSPAQFDAAVAYLQGKMDGQSMAALVQKHFPDAVKALPAPAQSELDFSIVSFKNQRLLHTIDHEGREHIQRMRNDQMLADFDEFAIIIQDHFLMPSMKQLAAIVSAGVDALAKRLQQA